MHYLNQILLPFLTQKMDFAIYTLLALPLETTSTWLLIFISFYVNELVTNSFFQCILLNITSICFLYWILCSRLLILFLHCVSIFNIFLFWLITDRYGFIYVFCMKIETPCAIVYIFSFECVKIQGNFNAFQKGKSCHFYPAKHCLYLILYWRYQHLKRDMIIKGIRVYMII